MINRNSELVFAVSLQVDLNPNIVLVALAELQRNSLDFLCGLQKKKKEVPLFNHHTLNNTPLNVLLRTFYILSFLL